MGSGSRRRQGAGQLAGILKKNIYVVLAVLAVSGAAGFIVPYYLSYALYGVPLGRGDDSVLIVRREGDPQATPTWAKPNLPQVRVNFWVTSTSSLSAEVLKPATATPTPTAVILPTRTKHQGEVTTTSAAPTRTKKPRDPTSTPQPPRPTKTQAPPRPPTDTPAAAPSPAGALSFYGATPTPHELTGGSPGQASASTVLQLQGSAAGTRHPGFLANAAGSLWNLIVQWWN